MTLKKIKHSTLRFIGAVLLNKLITFLCKTLKVSCVNNEKIEQFSCQNKNFILGFWHGTMLLPWYMSRNKKMAALTSLSKDGEILAKLLKYWNYEVIRGSSSAGGEAALGMMVDYANHGYSIAVTPDGPRGPAKKFKAGAVIAAKRSGVPLFLVGIGFEKKKELKSWDCFQIPMFFSRAKAVFSEPIFIHKDLTYEQTSEIILKCEAELNRLEEEAGAFI